ncbi:MAG: polysaccharide pyruvyl transferase family protein [Pseudomonadota bacterium]
MNKTFEIRRAGFVNKGAAMMLITVVQKLEETLPGSIPVITPDHTTEFADRIRYGLWHRAEIRRYGFDLGQVLKMLPQRIRRRYGFITDSEVDIVLDAAGFAYSDQWTANPAIDLAKRAKDWSRNGKKLIMLPQAFGPFTSPEIREAMASVCEHASLIFARDKVSLQHLTDIAGHQDHIRLAPDFTNLLDHSASGAGSDIDGGVAIVPNARMIDKNRGASSDRYLPLMMSSIEILQAAGVNPFFLIHEGEQDRELALQINDRLQSPLKIEFPRDALAAKSIIANCDAVLASRYHALVSALSQGIPAIGTSWSHKYEMLFDDYSCPEALISPGIEQAELQKTLHIVTDKRARTQQAKELKTAAVKIKKDALSMWDDVLTVVNA